MATTEQNSRELSNLLNKGILNSAVATKEYEDINVILPDPKKLRMVVKVFLLWSPNESTYLNQIFLKLRQYYQLYNRCATNTNIKKGFQTLSI